MPRGDATTEGGEPVDGRTARRDRNRDAVLDAALELFRDDAMFPGPAEVAERSGVSRRSVQRYFDDMDALVRAAMGRHLERVGPLFEIEGLGVGALEGRIDRLVGARLRLYESVAPMVRAALLRARSSTLIRDRLIEARAALFGQVEAMFAPELAALDPAVRGDVLAALDVLLGFESIERLGHGRALPPDEVHRILARATATLLGQAHPPA